VAGLKKGDLITQVQGQPVKDMPGLVTATAAVRGGKSVKLTVKRGDETKVITIKTSEGI